MNRKAALIGVALGVALAGPATQAGQVIPCASLDSVRTSAAAARAGDALLADNLFEHFCPDITARFDADDTRLPAFVTRYFQAPAVEAQPVRAGRRIHGRGPNGGGGGGKAY